MELMQNGSLDMARSNASELEAFEESYGALNLPYIFVSADHYYDVLTNDIGADILASSEDKGFIGLAYYIEGARSFYANKAIHSPADLKGMKIRVQPSPSAIRMVELLGGNPTPMDHELVPSAVFTQPEFGTVGLSEEEAREQEPVEIYSTSFRPMQTAFAGRSDRVMMKLVVSKATRKVLGCHIVAPNAGEMIQLAGIAVKMGATKEDFDRTVAVHPTMSEEIVTMRKPVRTA